MQATKVCPICDATFGKPARNSWKQWEARRCCSLSCANTERARQQAGYCGDWGMGDTKRKRINYRNQMRRLSSVWAARWEERRHREDTDELNRPSPPGPACRATQRPKRRLFIAGACQDCGGPFVVVHGWWHGSTRCSDCTHRHWKSGDHRIRARRYGVEYRAIDPSAIYERDGWRCQLCGDKVETWVNGKINPKGATLDHIVPMARGGSHTEDNVQCACWACNVAKGAGSANDQLRLAVEGGNGRVTCV